MPPASRPDSSGERSLGDRPSPREYRFPTSFLWGSAAASHQVEGGNRWNDWWEAEQIGAVPHRSGDACRSYELYPQDFDLARDAGQNAHRLSLEWSRIEPEQGRWDTESVRHYREVIEALRARGIEPVVTLHHFTLPLWAARQGGWTNRRCVRWFARYAEHVARELGDGVRYWVTINEPTVYVKHGFVTGDWPPGRTGDWAGAARATVNLMRGHCAARARIRALHPGAAVGIAHSAPLVQPCNPARRLDRFSAWISDFVLNRAVFALSRVLRPGPLPFDFIGLNYYTRAVVRGGLGGRIPFAGTDCRLDHHDRGPISDTEWEIYPAGLLAVLRRFARYGRPLLVTENGVATGDEELRSWFLREHLARIGAALDEGIDVRGYFYWSLMDNFEWALGTGPRFGLFAVDFETQERTARPALEYYREVCRTGRLTVPRTETVA